MLTFTGSKQHYIDKTTKKNKPEQYHIIQYNTVVLYSTVIQEILYSNTMMSIIIYNGKHQYMHHNCIPNQYTSTKGSAHTGNSSRK